MLNSALAIQGLVVLVIYMIGMLFIGIYCNKHFTSDLSGFLAGGRSIGPWVFALLYGSTYLSSSTFIGNTGTAYVGGLAFLFMPVPQLILLPVGILLFSHALRKMSKHLDVLTVPEFIARRYKSPLSGLLASLLIIIFMVPYMVAVVKGGAVSLEQLLGISYPVAVFLVSGVACLYLMAGGFMARAYTDVVQGVMMAIGMLFVLIGGFYIIGGPATIAAKVSALDPQLVETPGPLGWSQLLLFSTVFAISPWGLPQLVQTNFTIRDRKVVYTSSIVLAIWVSAVLFGSMIIGNMGRAYFGNQLINEPDQIFPAMVLTFFPNIFGAIIICAVIAAAMSTIDGVLMTAGTSFSVDIYKKFFRKDASDKEVLLVTNITMVVMILAVIIWAFNPPKMLLNLTSYAFSVIAGGLLVPIFFGMFYKEGTPAACLTSIMVGSGVTFIWYIIKINNNYILGIPPFVAGTIIAAISFLIVSQNSAKLPKDFVDGLFSKEADLATYEN
ncbi:MAG: sodium:solute symporter family transporter [Tepidanaerobacteraceae bacterium]